MTGCPDCTLVFDFGTTALKTALIDRNFEFAAVESFDFTYDTPAPGRMECDPYLYLKAMSETARKIVPGHSVRRIVITGQAETLIFIGRDGNPMGKAIVWLDDRAKTEAESLARKIPKARFYAVTGNPSVDPVMPLCKLPWVRENLPELDAAYAKALLLHEWAVKSLTGEEAAEYGILSCSGYFDVVRQKYDTEILEVAGIDERRLASAMPPFAEVGKLSKEGAELLGLPIGIPVSNGTLDQCASAIGAGNIVPGRLTETTGTVLAIAATLERFEPGKLNVPVLCHGIRGRYLALPYGPTAGGALKSFQRKFMPQMSFAEIDAEAEKRPEDDLICLPHFCGKVSPEFHADAAGMMLGMTLDTTPIDMARAIMEGVAFLLKENVDALAGCGCTAEEILSFGGGANSSYWTQLKADVLQIPVTAAKIAESTSLGAALGAALYAEEIRESELLARKVPGERHLPQMNPKILEKYKKYLDYSEKLGVR